jgi:UDP-glucose 4-epimerase
MNSVLITGVTGFIGRYVADLFVKANWLVIGLGTQTVVNIPNISKYISLVLPNEKLEEVIKSIRPTVCIHCAGRAAVNLSVLDPSIDFNASVGVTFQLLNSLRLHAPECKFIYLSSAAVYGNPSSLPVSENQSTQPISPYGFHKLICEQLCQEFYKVYGLQTAIARIFSGYGNGLKRQVIWDICYKALNLPELKLHGTGLESRDFIHGQDIAKAIYLISQTDLFQSNVFNLASGNQTTIREILELILRHLNSNINTSNIKIEFDGVVPVGNPLNWCADISRITDIGFTPEVSLDHGISTYIQWCFDEVKA